MAAFKTDLAINGQTLTVKYRVVDGRAEPCRLCGNDATAKIYTISRIEQDGAAVNSRSLAFSKACELFHNTFQTDTAVCPTCSGAFAAELERRGIVIEHAG